MKDDANLAIFVYGPSRKLGTIGGGMETTKRGNKGGVDEK
jgi:hypothetical protein